MRLRILLSTLGLGLLILARLAAERAEATLTLDWVTVGARGNAVDPATGLGALLGIAALPARALLRRIRA